MSLEKNEAVQSIEKNLDLFITSLTVSEKSEFSAKSGKGKKHNGLSDSIREKLKNHFDGKELAFQKDIIENKDFLPEYLRMQLAAIMNNLKVEHPATLSPDSRNILNQRLRGGQSESSKSLSVPSMVINESLNKISNLIDLYGTNNAYQDHIDLLKEIDNFMTIADLKILSHSNKNDTELMLQPNVIQDAQLMLAHMKILALYGQELSGDKDFGKERIANTHNALENTTNKLTRFVEKEMPSEKETSSDKIDTVQEIDQLISQFESEKEISPPPRPKEDPVLERLHRKIPDFNMTDFKDLKKVLAMDDLSPKLEEQIKDVLIYAGNALENELKTLSEDNKPLPKDNFDEFKLIFDQINIRTGMGFSMPDKMIKSREFLGAFLEGDVQEYEKHMKMLSTSTVEERALEQGPLPLNNFTHTLESIIKDILLDNESVKLEIRDNNKMYAIYNNGKEHDMSEILQKSDFNQIILDTSDLDAYEKFLRTEKVAFAPRLTGDARSIIGDKAKLKWAANQSAYIDNLETVFNAKDKPKEGEKVGKLANLSLSEKLALNIYTTEAYGQINGLLRGQMEELGKNDKSSSNSSLKEILLATAVSVHGLNKASEKEEINTFRIDINLPQEVIDKRKNAATNKGIILEVGFISTNMDKPSDNFVRALENPERNPTGTVVKGLIGVDVSSVSCHVIEFEKEFLIPPSQFQMDSGVKVGNTHFFSMSPVRSPEGLRLKDDLEDLFTQDNNSIVYVPKPSPTRPIQVTPKAERLPPSSQSVEAQFKQDEAMFRTYLEGGGENVDVLKRIFYAVQQGGLSDSAGDFLPNPSTQEIPLAAALSHGGRIIIEIPRLQEGEDPHKFFEWIRGNNPNIFQRSAATHSLEIDDNGKIKELKLAGGMGAISDAATYASDYTNNRHFGLNIGLGLDKNGNPVAASENGENGHLYMYWVPPTKNKPGALMVGCEACAPGKISALTGAAHGPGGQASETSLTGGSKWTDTQTMGDYAPHNGMYAKLKDHILTRLKNNTEYRNIQNSLGKPTLTPEKINQINSELITKLDSINNPSISQEAKISLFEEAYENRNLLKEGTRLKLASIFGEDWKTFISEKNALSQTKLNATLTSLYPHLSGSSEINLKDNISNNYNYNEYHSSDRNLEVRIFNQESYNGPKTEDFMTRAKSLYNAAVFIIPDTTDREKILNALKMLLENTEKSIQQNAAIDPQKMRSHNGPEYFAEKQSVALDLLQQHIIDSLDIIHDGQKYDLGEALHRLEAAESEVVAKTGRPNLLHIYDVAGHARVSLSETQGNHTNPSTMRDKPELSNFVKVSSGYVDKDGTAKIEFSAYRHSSYPPIKILGSTIEDKIKRRVGAAQSVEQMIKTLAEDMLAKNPHLFDASKPPCEINLSSMLLLTPLLKDQKFMGGDSEMRQLKDSLIALNIYHNQEITLNINGQNITVKPILTQMNIPSNSVMKAQLKKLGGEFNNNVNNKGFYEYNKNFMKFMESDNTHSEIKAILEIYKNDPQLINLETKLQATQKNSNLSALYKELGNLQKDPEKTKEYKETLTKIRIEEKKLNAAYKDIITRQTVLWEENQDKLKKIRTSIENELKDNPDNKPLQIAQLYLDSADIYYSQSHKKPEHGHQFQTRYLLANQAMGIYVEFFCKSGEDRTGRANNHLEEFLSFRRENGFFPRFNNKEDSDKLKPIARAVQKGSVSIEITNQNAPGGKGLQQDSSFGSNKDLQLGEFDLKNAQMAKGVYAISITKKLKHSIQIQFTHTDLEKEFEMITNQFQDFIKEKFYNMSDFIIKPTLQNTELSKLEGKANRIFSDLDANTNNLSDTTVSVRKEAKELSDICHEIRELRTTNADPVFHQKIKQVEDHIKSRLDTLTTKVTHHINNETGRKVNSSEAPTLSGMPTSSLEKGPLQAQNGIIQALRPIFKAPEFTLTSDSNQSVIIKKFDEEKNLAAVSRNSIESYSMTNSVDDYKLMIQAAAKMFEKPLLIYVPESEKQKFDRAIDDLKSHPTPALKDKDFECTTNRQDYEIKQKLKEQALVLKQEASLAATPTLPLSKEEDIHTHH